MEELYKKHRPSRFKHVHGQSAAVSMLEDMVKTGKIPHAILFTGPSGTGKTTLARILKDKLQCGDRDYCEVNSADFSGIDMVRGIRSRMTLSPISGKCRVWLIDESHKLSGDAQTAFLKYLEDTPTHVYFMLCTTDPGKLKKEIHTRCTEIKTCNLSSTDQEKMLKGILEKEGVELGSDVLERIVEVSDGSARKALVILQQIIGLETEEEQLEAIRSSDSKRQAIEIARALLNPKTKWPEMAAILKSVDEEPESIRHMVLSYMNNVLLGGKQGDRAYLIITMFSGNWYDCKESGLTAACWEIISA